MGLLKWLSARADRKLDEKDPAGAPFRQEIRAKEAWFVEEVNKRGLAWWYDPLVGIARHEWCRVLMSREELEAIVAAIDAEKQKGPERRADWNRRFNKAAAAVIRRNSDA